MKSVLITLLLTALTLGLSANSVTGKITDAKSGEEMIGVTIRLKDHPDKGTTTDLDGRFTLAGIGRFPTTIVVSFIGYVAQEIVVENASPITIKLSEESQALSGVEVSARRSTSSEVSMIASIRNTNLVVSGVSSQQITKTQDRDASEVIKRIPGISIIDNRFIIARGLAQRYNNVWVNNNAVPSSEADSRSFSFDMIPSGQIENVMIVKSPAPELPADFSGAFVKIATKNMSDDNSLQVNYGININTATHFQNFKSAKGSSTDFLGYDNGFRGMRSAVPSERMNNQDQTLVNDVTNNGFNNDWSISNSTPLFDHRFSAMLNRFERLKSGSRLGIVAAMNYSYSYSTQIDMVNARFGVYNKATDEPYYNYKYDDDQYTTSVKVGAMLNVILMQSSRHHFEFRNIFNQQGRDRYTYRDGWQSISGFYEQTREEYNYNSRGSYTGQFSGNHSFTDASKLDWTLGYAYANRNQPDRRQVDRDKSTGTFSIDNLYREYNRLDEQTYSFGTNYNHDLAFGNFTPSLKLGTYTEYRDRDYTTRKFNYFINTPNLPSDFTGWSVADMMQPEYFGSGKVYVNDATDNTHNYAGNNLLNCGYLGLNLPLGKFNVYAGVRYENNRMELTEFRTISGTRADIHEYTQSDFFPSVNTTYNIDAKNLLRLAYGKSINRPEFREVSPSVYYDFDLSSFVRGNKDLKSAYIQNFDLRYELYPSREEMVSFAVFYKRFNNPIEWTFIDAGGTYTFTFENARRADNYGIELDVKKSLDFMGLPEFSLAFNGALISSEVTFEAGSLDHSRPMQGQSPYLINTGLFYQKGKCNAGAMYNVIGKRIVGIGRSDNSQGSTIENDVPDMFEMPRHVLDLSFSYKFSARFELSAGIRDVFASPVVYKQFPQFTDDSGRLQEREQITKSYRTGQNFSLSARFNL